MSFGMRLIDAYEFSCSTSTADLWSGPVTLKRKKRARKSALARTKTHV